MSDDSGMGMYSALAAEKYGTTFWSTPDGSEIEITARCSPSQYLWPDATVVGEVVDYIREGQKGAEPCEDLK